MKHVGGKGGQPGWNLKFRSMGIFAVKLLVTGGCFWYIARQIDGPNFIRLISSMSVPWVMLATLAILVELPLAALRWGNIIDLLDSHRHTPFGTITALTAIGLFFGQVLPFLAGDTIRFWLLTRLGYAWREALVSTLIDRGVGLLALVAISFFIVLCPSPLADESGYRGIAQQAFGIILAVGVGGLALARPISAIFVRWRFTRWLGQFGFMAYDVLLRSRRSPAIFGLAVSVHVLTVLSIWCLGRALHLALSLFDAGVLFTVMISVALLPISVGGWGLREMAVTSLLHSHGVPLEQALLLSVSFGVVLTIAFMPGATVWALYTPQPASVVLEEPR
jgi:uncharacterized membrane protein YbhN (UPF0104 family)